MEIFCQKNIIFFLQKWSTRLILIVSKPIVSCFCFCFIWLCSIALNSPILPYVALYCPMLPYVALRCPILPYVALCCLMLPYVALSYLKVGLYCSKVGITVSVGWWVVVQTNNHVKPNSSCIVLDCYGVVLGLCCG